MPRDWELVLRGTEGVWYSGNNEIFGNIPHTQGLCAPEIHKCTNEKPGYEMQYLLFYFILLYSLNNNLSTYSIFYKPTFPIFSTTLYYCHSVNHLVSIYGMHMSCHISQQNMKYLFIIYLLKHI